MNLPSRGATVFLWHPARLPHAGVHGLAAAWRVRGGECTGLITYSEIISW